MYDWRFKAFGRLEAQYRLEAQSEEFNCIAPWRSAPYHPVDVLFNGLRPPPVDATVNMHKMDRVSKVMISGHTILSPESF